MTIIATDRSLRRELKEFIEEILESEDTVNVDKLVRLAYDRFQQDEWAREALIREGLAALVPPIAGHVRHELRTRARRERGPATLQERIASVFEHVGSGCTKSVLVMRRPEHLFAAEEREAAARGQLRWAGFHRAVAALHTDDETMTGALPPQMIADLWREHIEAN